MFNEINEHIGHLSGMLVGGLQECVYAVGRLLPEGMMCGNGTDDMNRDKLCVATFRLSVNIA